MTTAQKILARKSAGQPFIIYLSDGRSFLIPHSDFCSTDPRGTGTSVTIYDAESQEHWVPIFAITSVTGSIDNE